MTVLPVSSAVSGRTPEVHPGLSDLILPHSALRIETSECLVPVQTNPVQVNQGQEKSGAVQTVPWAEAAGAAQFQG